MSDQKFSPKLTKGIFTAFQVWAGWRPSKIWQLIQRYHYVKAAAKRRRNLREEAGIVVPPIVIFSVTMECNLDCTGCYSRNYALDEELNLDQIRHLFQAASDLGTAFFVLTGGEPLLKQGILDLAASFPQLVFLLFTNGSFISKDVARQIKSAGNIIPMLSVEGNEAQTDERRGKGVYAQVLQSMRLLKQKRVFSGFSTVVSQVNQSTITSDDFYDHMIAQGCSIGLLVNYVPIQSEHQNLLLSAEEQAMLRSSVQRFQQSKKMILLHMPDDEYDIGGTCMAAGKGFIHINARGDVEPCPFAQMATHNIKHVSLKEALQNPLFSHIRENAHLMQKPVKGCALFENRNELIRQKQKLGIYETIKK